MDSGQLVQLAEYLLSEYREILIVDPFFRIKVELGEGDFISSVSSDGAPLTWVLKLNPVRHETMEDVHYSVIEALLKTLFAALDAASVEKIPEIRDGLVSRLATAISGMLPVSGDSSEEGSSEIADDPEENEGN